jgi:Zn-finger nucleic acid-binding protein
MLIDTEKSIEVDICPEHGIWLDKGELERIVLRSGSSSGSNYSSRQIELDRAYEQGKWEGIWFDIWSLFSTRKR